MKSKDLKQLVFSKRQNGESPAKVFRDLNVQLVTVLLEDGAK